MDSSRKIRVCHVVTVLDVGGMENGVVNLLNHHDRKLFMPMLCCLNRKGAMIERLRPDVEVFDLGLPEGQKPLLYGPAIAARLFPRREWTSCTVTDGEEDRLSVL